jgi:hypothetical protein
MVLGADDYGVIPMDGAVLRALDRVHLARLQDEEVVVAMKRVLQVELFLPFDHQGDPFAFDPRWQTFQKVRYPRGTHYPAVPEANWARCDERTRTLHAGRHFRNDYANVSEMDLPARGGCAQANANGSEVLPGFGEEGLGGGGTPGQGHPVRDVLALYERLFTERVKAPPVWQRGKDAKLVSELIHQYGQAEVATLLRRFFDSQDPWIRQTGFGLGAFKASVNKLLAQESQDVKAKPPAGRVKL